ncbi:MAG TPA: tetratricopeptide repeat protein [Gracilimonas sp.]|uniref:tetratricopeptide repeat protein n=1 Tax=Gracilimonas sp. TaxID=1974203 RepID=UPI002D89783F|nr:tetratricopeptide repeat protein [Gracilimonas sp.]
MKLLKIILCTAVLGLAAFQVDAQDRTQAVQLYNKGLEEAQANDYESAISTFTQVVSVAEQLGPEGEDIKENAESQIPKMYYGQALAIYKEFQTSRDLETLDRAISAFRDVVEISEEYGDDRYVSTVEEAIPKLQYTKSVLYYNNEEFEKANEAVDQALNSNTNYAAAYYQKAKIFKKMNDTEDDGIIDEGIDEMLEWYDRAIQVGESTNEQDVAQKATESAHDELLAVGTRALQNGNLDYAIETLNKALDYDSESADVYYRLAEAHNKAGNAQEAIDAANQSLEYENGGRTDRAKIYYELGYAMQTLGNNSEACDAFTNALYGQFRGAAEHKMEFELKCDSTTR